MAHDIGELIQMTEGGPNLAEGQHTVLPEDNVPTTAEQIIKHTGIPKVLTPAQQANNDTLNSIANGTSPKLPSIPATAEAKAKLPPREVNNLPPLVPGPPSLFVTDTGNAQSPSTQGIASSAKLPSIPQPSSQATSQQPPMQLPVIPVAVQQFADPLPPELNSDFVLVEGDGDAECEEDEAVDIASPPPPTAEAIIHALQHSLPKLTPDPAPVTLPPVPAVVLQSIINATPQVTIQKFAGDDELDSIKGMLVFIQNAMEKARFDSGIAVLADPRQLDINNYLHVTVRRIRWESTTLCNLGPQELLAMEAVLTAHQVWVQSEENYWSGRYTMLGRELERIIFIKRENYSSATKTEAENKLIAAEPRVRELRADYMLAQAMATIYKDQGARFAQLEDGIKRTISMVIDEYNRQKMQQKYVA